MNDNDRDRMLLDLLGNQGDQGAILHRLDRDVPQLYEYHQDHEDRLRFMEDERRLDSGRRSGVSAAWAFVLACVGLVGTVVAIITAMVK